MVDNASWDAWEAIVDAARPDATVVRQRNLGFGAGCNAGVRATSARVVVFLNPDAELEIGSLERLVELVATHGCVAGPALFSRDGTLRFDCRRSSRWWQDAIELLPYAAQWMPMRLRRDLPPTDPIYGQGGEVPYLQGACLAMPREAFDSVDGFDERFFLYAEEEDLCDRLRAVGLKCLYDPGARVIHLGGASTAGVPYLARRSRYRSMVLLYAKRGQAQAYIAGTAALLALSIRRAEHMLRRHLGRQEWSSPDDLSAICAGILEGLREVAGVATSRASPTP